MRRLFLCSLASSLTIIGSIIGAGFITGKEVFEFFAKDFSLSGIYLTFICFSFTIYFVMSGVGGDGLTKWVEAFVSLANVVVAGCMVSALNSVYKTIFHLSENVKLLSIISTILLLFIAFKGIESVEKFCSVILPFVIIIVIALCVYKIDGYSMPISPKSNRGIIKPFIYVGFNVVLSAGIIKNSGEKLSPLFKIIASLLTSFTVCICVFLLALAVKEEGFKSEMPFISLYYSNKKLLKIIDIITLFAIYSTLISSLYTINRFGGIKLRAPLKIGLFITVFLISELGFSSIVERVYPALGILAYAFILISYPLQSLFLKGQRGRTSRLLRCRE